MVFQIIKPLFLIWNNNKAHLSSTYRLSWFWKYIKILSKLDFKADNFVQK